jgi:hypothetical protein
LFIIVISAEASVLLRTGVEVIRTSSLFAGRCGTASTLMGDFLVEGYRRQSKQGQKEGEKTE